MKWEYGVLYILQFGPKHSSNQASFIGPKGTKSLNDDGYIVYLNQLGQDGWESYSTNIRDIRQGTSGIEFYFFLKRPITN